MTSVSTGVLLLILGLCVLVLFLIVFSFLLIVRARKTAKKAEETNEDLKEQSAAEQAAEKLPSTFVQAITNLRERVTGPEYRYKVPWFVMLGPEGSGKTTLLTQSRLHALLEEDGQSFPGDTPVGWKFYGDGMVLDTAGEWTFPGKGKSSSYWKRLLRLLNQYRPERPLEGIIVTLAVTDLIGPTALDGTTLSRRASILQERLQEAQEILGFRLPLYFLLTKCDCLPGFTEFARELPNDRLSEIFGWSNPHSLDSLFDENWILDAFQGMRRTVEELEDQIYVQNGYSSGRQNMFILPDYLAALGKPINIFLSRVLKKADLEGAYALRGIYLTGEAGAQTNVAAPSKQQLLPPNHYPELSILPSMLNTWQEGNAEKIAFVHDLFVAKIFPECNLAQPVKKFFSARNKTSAILQTTSIVTFFILFAGTILAYTRLRQNAATLSPILKQIAADLQPKAEETYHYDPTEDFLIRLAGFKASGFHFIFLPSSWTGPLDRQIRTALVPAFRLLVLEHFRDGLTARAHEITSLSVASTSLPQPSGSGANITDLTVLPEYMQLHAFTQQLNDLERNIALYQTLAASGGVASAPTVFSIESYLNEQNKSSFPVPDAENPYFAEALANATFKPFVISPSDRSNATQKMTNLTSALFSSWIGRNPIRRSLDNLSEQLEKVQSNPASSDEDLQTLRQYFRVAQTNFDNPALQWVAKDDFAMPGPLYGATITPLENSIYLNKDLTNWVTYDAENRFKELQDAISQESSDVTGPLVEVTEEEKLAFSANADNARLALSNLLGLPFLASTVEKNLASVAPAGTRVVWNTALLQNAAQLPQAYENYIDSDLEDSPPKLRTLFQRIAQRRLQRALETEIAQAQTLVPQIQRADFQQDVQPQIESFSASGDALAGLLVTLREQQMSELYDKLLRLSTNQASRLLVDLDRSFEEEKIYTLPVASYDQWTGNTAPTEAILDARTPDDIAAYLTQQRETVRSYSQSAAPLLRFLGQQSTKDFPSGTLALINKWKAIAITLSQYDKKSPANSLTALESFISLDMDKVVPAQMCPVLPVRASISSGDYFLRAKANLRGDLYRRCRAIATFNLTRDYRDLQNTFNSQLAGHFPFADPLLADKAEGADPQAVNAFYQKFDAKASLLQNAIRQTNSGSQAYQDILLFLDRMAQLRSVFPTTNATDTAAVPAIDFQPAFRVNRTREIDADQVLSWTLSVGNDVFRSGEPPRLGHWTYGQPVTLSLQWAKDAPSLPLKGTPSGDGTVSGPVIRFQFKDSWALLSMLLRHGAPASQVAPGKDTSPFVLQFQAYESAPGNYRPGNAISSQAVATVFLQMNLFPSGAKLPLQQMVFPTRAADLPSDTATSAKVGER